MNRILGKFFATRLREKIYAVFLKNISFNAFFMNFRLQALFEAGRAVSNLDLISYQSQSLH